MTIGKCLMLIVLFFAVPLNLNPSRRTLYEVLNKEPSNKLHYILSVILQLSSCVLAIFFYKIKPAFSFLGGTTGVLMAVTIPGVVYVKLSENQWTSPKNFFILLSASILTVFGFIGAFYALVSAF